MRKFFKWLAGLFSSNTVVTVGSGNNTFVSQTTTTVTKIPPLTPEEISQIATKAVENVAAQKIVTNAIAAERKPVKTSPGPNAKVMEAEKLKRAVAASKNRPPAPPAPPRSRVVSDDDSYRRRSDDAVFINTTTISDTYTHHTPSHNSGYDPSPSCDGGGTFTGGCD